MGLMIDHPLRPAPRTPRHSPTRLVRHPWISDVPVDQADEPYVRKWPLPVRAVVLLGLSFGLWALIAGVVAALLTR